MAIKGTRSTQLANNPSVSPVKFNFKTYDAGNDPFRNDNENIDFVSWHGNLYVYAQAEPGYYSNSKSPEENGFMLLVAKGEDGQRGIDGKQGPAGEMPKLTCRFNGKYLEIRDNGTRVATSPDLTGPAWKPVRSGDSITWELSRDGSRPDDIDLNDLRDNEPHPVLFRLNSDNTKRSDEESGPGYYIQWKREGNGEWTNLMSISELMNLALAGVSFWEDETDGKIHFGHRMVEKATYDSTALGNKKIAEVELGDILFDAGAIPYPDDFDEIGNRMDALELFLCDIQNKLNNLNLDGVVRSVNSRVPDSNGNVLLDIPDFSNVITAISGDRGNLHDGNYLLTDINVALRISNGVLEIRYNNDNEHWITVGNVGGNNGSSSNAIVNVSRSGNNLIFTKADNTTLTVDLPSGGSGGGSSVIVNPSLSSGTQIATITVDSNTYTLYAPTAGGVGTILFKVEDGHLKYKIDNNGWSDAGELPSGGNADLNKIKLRIRTDSSTGKKYLEISRDDGITYVEPLELPSGSGSGDEPIDLSSYLTAAQIADLYYNKTQCNNKFALKSEISQGLEYYRTFTIYKRTESNTQVPTLPVAGVTAVWDVPNGVLTLPAGYTEWTNHPENATSTKPYLWLSSATFRSSDGSMVDSNWETPICLTGENGEGVDGDGIEFIYHLGSSAPNIDYTKSKKGSDTSNRTKDWWSTSESRDWVPGDGTNNGYWTDDPSGIEDTSENVKTEWAAVRTYDGNSKEWNDFSAPFRWAMWGEDGVDGAGVEYIFYVAGPDSVTVDPSTLKVTLSTAVWAAQIPTRQNQLEGDNGFNNLYHYQIDDWCPDGTVRSGYQMPDFNWTDNPSDVDAQQPYEFVCIRKFKDGSGWGPFSEPKLWGYYGTTTIQTTVYGQTNSKPYTCYAFHRTNTNISGYTVSYDFSSFGNAQTTYNDLSDAQKDLYYNKPQDYVKTSDGNTVLSNFIWYDTIPSGTEQLWLITAHIGDEGQTSDTGWTSPQKWGDQAGFQVEYANASTATNHVYNHDSGYVLPNLGKLVGGVPRYETDDPSLDTDGDGIDETTWRSDVQSGGMGIWGDENDISDPDYMATCFKRSNGVWTEWQIAKIKGEKGEKGDDGNNYRIGTSGSSLYAEEITSGSYSISGNFTWKLYKNGVLCSNEGHSEAWLSGNNAAIVGTNSGSNGSGSIPNNTTVQGVDNLYVNIIWFEDVAETKVFDSIEIPISIKGKDGSSTTTYQYLEGKVMRVSDWTDPQLNYYDGTDAVTNEDTIDVSGNGIYYLDIVKYTANGSTDYYKCIDTIRYTSKSSTNPKSDSELPSGNHWQVFSMVGDAAFHNLLVDEAAYIESLTSKQVVITDNNVVVAGMTSGSVTGTELDGSSPGNVRIWAGATEGNIQSAPFRVNADGSMYATNATISGNVTANTINVGGNSVMNIRIVQGTISNPEPNTLYIQY